MDRERKKILVTVDGSEQTFEAVDYLSGVVSAQETEIVLFHVMSKVPESFWDWEKDPLVPKHLEHLKKWESEREGRIRNFMRRVREMLVEAGVPEYSVMISIQKVREGIARDIIMEADRGYDAVLIGRKGMGGAEKQFLGSVADKVAGKLSSGNVWLVDGTPRKGKILIAVDSSDSATRAVRHVARMATSHHGVGLLHVVRGISVSAEGQEEIFPEGYRQRLLEEAESQIRPVFERASRRLAEVGGIRPEKVFTKIITGVASRAEAIYEEAVQGGYGTIVVGRKGLSRVEAFDMGRVTNKLSHRAKGLALWVVA
jgi:nucleotide-binding universal stress UspA family protein